MRHVYLNTPDGSACNLKPSQLVRAAILTGGEFNRIQSHMDWQANMAKDAVQRQKQIQALKKCSQKIVSNWKNTLLNKQRSRLEKRRLRMQSLENYKNDKYQESVAVKAKERDQKLDDVRHYFLLQRDDIKKINAAYVFAQVLREREAQLKFQEAAAAREKQKKEDYDNRVKADVEFCLEKDKKKKETILQEKYNLRDEWLTELRKRNREGEGGRKLELELEKEDLIRMQEQMDLIEENRKKQLELKKQIRRDDHAESMRFKDEARNFQKLMLEHQDKAINIYLKYKKRIDCGLKKQLAEEKEDALKRRWETQLKIAEEMKESEMKSARWQEKILQESAENADKDAERRLGNITRLREERIRDIAEAMERRKEAAIMKAARHRWETALSFKKQEADKIDILKSKEDEWEKKMDTRRGYNEQIEEHRENAVKEKEEDLRRQLLILYDEKRIDKAFLEYANKYLEKCRQHGSSQYPILKEIADYRLRHGLNNTKKHETRRKQDEKRWGDLAGTGTGGSGEEHALTVWKPLRSCSLKCPEGKVAMDGECVSPMVTKLNLLQLDKCGRKIPTS